MGRLQGRFESGTRANQDGVILVTINLTCVPCKYIMRRISDAPDGTPRWRCPKCGTAGSSAVEPSNQGAKCLPGNGFAEVAGSNPAPSPIVLIRMATTSDMAYVKASWNASARIHRVPRPLWRVLFGAVQDGLLGKSSCHVACLPDEPDAIVGYAITGVLDGQKLVHWVQVKHAFQRCGVARQLMAAAGCTKRDRVFFTHQSPFMATWVKPQTWAYVPHWLL